MAANMKAVKLRMKSIQSTMQITKAMELVASSKLRRAKERADASRPYFHTLRDTLAATMPTCLKRWKRRWQERTVLCFPSEKRR